MALTSFVALGMWSEGNVPKKWRTNSCFLLHDNAPAHQSVLVKDFLAKNNVTTLVHSPHSPDLGPPDFYLFPLLKSALKGWCFVMQRHDEECDRRAEKAFTKWLPEMFPTPQQWLAKTHSSAGRKCNLNNRTVLYFSEVRNMGTF